MTGTPSEHKFPGLLDILARNPRRPFQQTQAEALRQLRTLLDHAYRHVPLYRRLWDDAGVRPDQVATTSDLAHFPMVDKDMIVDASDDAKDERVVGVELDGMSTSGTSGRAITMLRTAAEMRVTRRSFLRALVYNGLRPWHRTVTFASTWLSSKKGAIVSKIARVRHIHPKDSLDRQIDLLKSFRARNLIGQTGGVYLLARELLRRGMTHRLHALIPTGATLMPQMRQAMRDAFLTEPRDLYGAVELGAVSWQGPCGNYHVDSDRIIVEIVDEHGRPVPDGRKGQVVCTSLYGMSVPLIRYRLLDVSALHATGPESGGRGCACSCGIQFPTMDVVRGRINDFLPTASGDLVSPHFLYHVFDHVGGSPVKEWRIIQEQLDHLVYEYIPEDRFDAEAFRGGMDVIRKRFGAETRVEPVEVNAIPMTPNGKRTCIVSRLERTGHEGMRPWDGVDEQGMFARPAEQATEALST